MRAIFIAVGSELLERNNIDTNSIYITQKLIERGILTDMKAVIGDDILNLSWFIKNAFKRAQLVIVTGGLGPTEDDITREATAEALKRDLIFKEELVETIREQFKKRGMEMAQINTRQAFIVDGAEVIPNPNGTAPGLFIDDENCKVLLLPGPPNEMMPMFDRVLEEKLAPMCRYFIYKRSFKLSGIGESDVDALIAPIYTRYQNPRTTILASPGLIQVHLLGRSRKTVDEARALTDELAEKIKEAISHYLITEEDISTAEHVVRALTSRGLTVSTAESCTGGGIGNAITNVPGSSAAYLGGIIAYSNDLKMKLLEVQLHTLDRYGAVSKETAREMAQGLRKLTGSDIAISVTGIAGPDGGSSGKPVGLVFFHLSSATQETGIYKIFPGAREIVKERTIQQALFMIHQYLKELKQ